MLNGSKEFCQEFLTDVRVPDTDRIGEVDDGWTVGTRWMFHERMRHNSPLVTIPVGAARAGIGGAAMPRHRPRRAAASTTPAPGARSARPQCSSSSATRCSTASARASRPGTMSGPVLGRSAACSPARADEPARSRIAFELAGATGAAWTDDDGELAGRGTTS